MREGPELVDSAVHGEEPHWLVLPSEALTADFLQRPRHGGWSRIFSAIMECKAGQPCLLVRPPDGAPAEGGRSLLRVYVRIPTNASIGAASPVWEIWKQDAIGLHSLIGVGGQGRLQTPRPHAGGSSDVCPSASPRRTAAVGASVVGPLVMPGSQLGPPPLASALAPPASGASTVGHASDGASGHMLRRSEHMASVPNRTLMNGRMRKVKRTRVVDAHGLVGKHFAPLPTFTKQGGQGTSPVDRRQTTHIVSSQPDPDPCSPGPMQVREYRACTPKPCQGMRPPPSRK
ncbi:uncharacterized protein THITE_2128871 [Thermothielavioides terrestris NRRL 8126]|uniref:Uncharacterized protein n=1 Tax=Thermothielavioides terrestris (strain ATCC 38088 / NRRL 8126) TaxID=578455 RepID=G2R4D1_THETT|nr:uncharacterized protein THITE_2128871 [Thermothielavioides terrestris NRRL 8126]AEO66875.1 hypothetical protein THITE_2128871 [Thermothielavioides terrestris NRRL 8126]